MGAGHHGAGHAVRFVPIAPRLRQLLAESFEAATTGEALVVPMAARRDANLRTTFEKSIERAGVKPWPKLFQNLRASCETDWVQTFPAHVVAKWLGHSPRIAQEHYLQVRDAHFAAAIEGSERGTKCGTTMAPNGAPQAFATSRNDSHARGGNDVIPEETIVLPEDHAKVPLQIVGNTGFEPVTSTV
jgi:hypothetical protein